MKVPGLAWGLVTPVADLGGVAAACLRQYRDLGSEPVDGCLLCLSASQINKTKNPSATETQILLFFRSFYESQGHTRMHTAVSSA